MAVEIVGIDSPACAGRVSQSEAARLGIVPYIKNDI
jgi:hypothetical protein